MWRPANWASSANTPSPSSTPPPQRANTLGVADRSYTPSPLGRAPSAASRFRPQLVHRSSTLSLASSSPNASTTSLPGAIKQQQSVGFRKAVSMPPPPGVRDPIHVLADILGAPVAADAGTVGTGVADAVTVDEGEGAGIDFGGLSLEEFVQSVDAELGGEVKSEPQLSDRSVEEYEKEKDNLHDLHRSIKACDEVLKSVESYLSAFQTDLGLVSSEIETLQNRSSTLNNRLENRKAVEKLLGPIVDDVVIPPMEVRRIVEGEVNDAWVQALRETDRRMKAIEGKDAEKVKAVREVKPELEKITDKAIERVRDFFVSRIKALRLPGANAQTIQQGGFLRYKDLLLFMASHNVQLADEIAQAYINTMRWYYLTHFQRYLKALEKLKVHKMDRTDTLGQEDPSRKNNLLPTLNKAALPSMDPLNIGHRISILQDRTAPLLPAYQAEDDKAPHYLEYPFRHAHFSVLENASSEYTFICDFFTYKRADQITAMFNAIFDPTFAQAQAFTRTLLDDAHDALGILLAVRLNQDAAFEMQKRRVPATDAHINATNMLLWPRLQIVMDLHCESLRRAAGGGLAGASAGSSAMRALAGGFTGGLGGGAAAGAGAGKQNSAAPHQLTQRFATFVQGILALSGEAGDDEPVANSLARLRSEFEAFLTRVSAGFADARKRERFLGNNYALVLTIIGDTEGKLAAEQKRHFEGLKNAFQDSP